MAVLRPAVDSFLPNFTHRYTATHPPSPARIPATSRSPPKSLSKSSLLPVLFFFPSFFFFLVFFLVVCLSLLLPRSSVSFVSTFGWRFFVENRVFALNFHRVRTHPVFGIVVYFRGAPLSCTCNAFFNCAPPDPLPSRSPSPVPRSR